MSCPGGFKYPNTVGYNIVENNRGHYDSLIRYSNIMYCSSLDLISPATPITSLSDNVISTLNKSTTRHNLSNY